MRVSEENFLIHSIWKDRQWISIQRIIIGWSDWDDGVLGKKRCWTEVERKLKSHISCPLRSMSPVCVAFSACVEDGLEGGRGGRTWSGHRWGLQAQRWRALDELKLSLGPVEASVGLGFVASVIGVLIVGLWKLVNPVLLRSCGNIDTLAMKDKTPLWIHQIFC